MLPVESPFKAYTDLDGLPLNGGFIYIGAPNDNPVTAPRSVYWDAAGTLPASQPLRTENGYIVRAGAPANIFIDGAYSELVLDKKGHQVAYGRTSDEFGINTRAGTILADIVGRLDIFNQPSTGKVFANEGAHVNRINDRLFVGQIATGYDGNGPAVTHSWVGDPSDGIYQYLETNAIFAAYAKGSSIGMFAAGRSSETQGTPGEVAIGMASFVHQDKPTGTAGVWNFYGTALREAGTSGPTHCMELDIANMGTPVIADPYIPNPAGLTNGIRICTGGETLGAGVATYALGIIQNDAGQPATASFDKGIVFHATSIRGTDGVTGTGTAIAFAKGHTISWYDAGHHEIAYVYSYCDAPAQGNGIIFTNNGMNVVSTVDGSTQFQATAAANAANFIQTQAAPNGGAPQLTVSGVGTNCDLKIGPRGTGLLHFVQATLVQSSSGAKTLVAYQKVKVNGEEFWSPLYN